MASFYERPPRSPRHPCSNADDLPDARPRAVIPPPPDTTDTPCTCGTPRVLLVVLGLTAFWIVVAVLVGRFIPS